MRRLVLGLFALVMFVGGVIALVAGRDGGGAAASIAIRVGVLLGAIWLAMPQLARIFQRIPPAMLGAIGIGLVMLVMQPRLLAYVLPLLGVLLVVQYFAKMFRPPARAATKPVAKRPVPTEKTQH